MNNQFEVISFIKCPPMSISDFTFQCETVGTCVLMSYIVTTCLLFYFEVFSLSVPFIRKYYVMQQIKCECL